MLRQTGQRNDQDLTPQHSRPDTGMDEAPARSRASGPRFDERRDYFLSRMLVDTPSRLSCSSAGVLPPMYMRIITLASNSLLR